MSGGQLKIEISLVSTNPYVMLAAVFAANLPFPSILNSVNLLVPHRGSLDLLKTGFASANGLNSHIIRYLQFADSDGDCAFEWVLQVFQFGQLAPTAHALGKNICSIDGYQLSAQ